MSYDDRIWKGSGGGGGGGDFGTVRGVPELIIRKNLTLP